MTEVKAVFRDLGKEYQERLDGMRNLKPRTQQYYNERLEAMLKSWPSLNAADVRKPTEDDCRQWVNRYAKQSCPTNFNNTLIVLRAILGIAVERPRNTETTAWGAPKGDDASLAATVSENGPGNPPRVVRARVGQCGTGRIPRLHGTAGEK